MQNLFLAATLLALISVATVWQLIDVNKGGRAAPLSFLIWVAVDVVSVSAQLASHPAPLALVLPFGQLASMSIVLVAAWLTSRSWGNANRSQRTAILLCITGLGVWLVMRNPLYALLGNVIANFAGVLPTWEQAWKRPHTLSVGFWMMMGGTVLVGLVVIVSQPFNVASLIPQLTGAFICWSIVAVRFVRLRMRPMQEPVAEIA